MEVTDYDPLGRVRLERQAEGPWSQSQIDDDTQGIKVQRRYQYGSGARYELASNPYRAATSSGLRAKAVWGGR